MKKIFSLLLCAAMTMSVFAETVKSGDCGKNGNNLTWVLDSEGVLTISGTGEMRDYAYANYPLWVYTAAYVAILKSVVIEDGVTTIGNNAFRECVNLSSVTIPDGITSIGESAFYGCSKLTSVPIPSSVTEIKAYAFSSCGLTSLDLPKSVETIGEQAFINCSALPAINVDAENPNFSDINGVLCNKSQTGLINYPQGKSATGYTIPSSVTEIYGYAFYGCSALTSLTIPNSVNQIGYRVFNKCTSLTSITCKAVAPPTLSYYPFDGSTNLAHIYVPAASVENYKGATNWSGKAAIISAATPVVGDTITYTYKGKTLYYKITKKNESGKEVAVVNEGLDYPTYWTDAHKPTGDVVIPDSIEDFMGTKYGVTGIGYEAFRNCTGITSIDFSENTHITSTSGNMCQGCTSLTSVILSDYITTIWSYTFSGCPLSSIDFKNVQKIYMDNFYNATFTSVHIPASLEYIEDQSYLFIHATTITCDAENTHFAAVDNVLYNKDLTKLIGVPCGYTAEQEVHLPSTVTSMAFSAFREFKGKVYINSEITCNSHGWSNSPRGAVVVGCGLYDYYTTGHYAGTSGDFQNVTSLTESLLWSVTATADAGGNVAILDTTNCNEVRIEATPAPGYKFVKWNDDNTDATRTVAVNSDVTFSAEFVLDSSTGIDQTTNDQRPMTNRKLLRDGQLIIERDGKFYNAQGAEVR